ncbi:hypothetical protein TNCV_1673211 [Trichonephila clavipes]|nr:hypothetical protein TNCV_1673211 [Trichonephila clavipes]
MHLGERSSNLGDKPPHSNLSDDNYSFTVMHLGEKASHFDCQNLRWKHDSPNPDSLNKKHLAIQKHSEVGLLAFYTLLRSPEAISIGWSFQRWHSVCLEKPSQLDSY